MFKVMAKYTTAMAIILKDNTTDLRNMERVDTYGMMLSIRVVLRKMLLKELQKSCFQVRSTTREGLRMASVAATVNTGTRMEMSFKVNGRTTKNYTGYINSMKETVSREGSSKIKSALA